VPGHGKFFCKRAGFVWVFVCFNTWLSWLSSKKSLKQFNMMFELARGRKLSGEQ